MNRLIFFSYSSKDENYARKLVKDIEKQGLQCWISCRDIMPGEDYQTAIVRALGQSAAMFLLFSKNANASAEIGKEMALATARHIRVIPARMEDVTPTGAFEYQFATAQYIDLFRNYNEALNRLCDVLRQQVGLPVEERKPSYFSLNKKPLLFGGVATLLAAGIGTTVFLYKPANMPAAVSTPVAAPALPSPNQEEVKQAAPAPAKIEAPPAPAAAQSVAAPAVAAPPPSAAAAQADNPDLEPLVEKITNVDPEMRMQAIQNDLTHITGKLSANQVLRILHGIKSGVRVQAFDTLLPLLQAPISVPVAVSLLQSTGDFRNNGIRQLRKYLPDSISADDLVALLGDLDQNARSDTIRLLDDDVHTELTPDQALKLLNGTNNYWTRALEEIAPKLAKPVAPDDLVRLLGETRNNNRFQSLKALSVAMPETISVADVNKLLDGTEGYRVQSIELFSHHTHGLPYDLPPADIVSLLNDTENGNRLQALNTLILHMQKNLQGTDVAPILEGINQMRYSAITTLRPNLAKPQSQASLMALLDNTTEANRLEILRNLHQFLPKQISAADAQALLQNMTEMNCQFGLDFLIPHMRRPSPEEIKQLVAPITQPQRSEAMAKNLSEIH